MQDGGAGGADVSRRVSEFVASSRAAEIPDALLHESKRSLLNFFAAALGGCGDAAVQRAAAAVLPFSGHREASIIGSVEYADALTAAFLNAISANVFDFDDTHPGTVIHPAAPVAAALLALAETKLIAGRDLLHALALGIEVECRIGNAVSPWHYAHGWHITSTCCVFGSAMAVGKCLGLDARHLLWTLGNASAQAGGLLEPLGFMSKSLGVGNAARNGMVAALCAQAGVEGPALPLEGPRGFLRVFGKDPDLGAITDRLGSHWEALRNTYKPYPCGIVLHAVIDCCLELRSLPEFAGGQIDEVIVRGHPLLGQRTNRPRVTTGREAQVSAQHAVAVSLLTGKAGLAEFSDAAVAAPSNRDLASKVRIEDRPEMSIEAAEVELVLAGGRRLVRRLENARGGEARRLSDRELETKLRDLVAFGGAGVDPDAIIAAVWRLELDGDAGKLMPLVRRS